MTRGAARFAAGILIGLIVASAGCQGSKKPKTITIIDDSAVREEQSRQYLIEADKEAQLAQAARAEYKDKDWNAHGEKAIGLYRQSIETYRGMYPAWNNLGMLLMDRGAYMDAAQCLETAADLSPTRPEPQYNIGVIYQTNLHDEKALEYFLKSLERDERYLPALRGATVAGKRLDITDEASLKRVRRALLLETDPKWRSIFETEMLRIEGSLTRAGKSTTGL